MLIALYYGLFCSTGGVDVPPEAATVLRNVPDVNLAHGGRRRKVGFEGLYSSTTNNAGLIVQEESVIPSVVQSVKSVKSAKSVSTSVVGGDLDFYRGRLAQKREEVIRLLSNDQDQTVVYCSKEYYVALGTFYEDLRRKIRPVVEKLIREHKNKEKMEEEANNRGWKFWKANAKDVAKKEKDIGLILNELHELLRQKLSIPKEAAQFPDTVRTFLKEIQDGNVLDDFDSMAAKDILIQIQRVNQAIKQTNVFIDSLQVPFRRCFEKGRWALNEVQGVKDCGMNVDLAGTIFDWSDNDTEGGYSLPTLMPIGIESPAAEEEKRAEEDNKQKSELTQQWVQQVGSVS